MCVCVCVCVCVSKGGMTTRAPSAGRGTSRACRGLVGGIFVKQHPPAELLLVAPGLLQLPACEALWVHLPGALAGADEPAAAVLCRVI